MLSQESIDSTDIKVLLDVENRLCLCGCNELIHAKDKCGRSIKYKVGHNRRGRKKIKDPIVVEVNRIRDMEEAKSHLVTMAKIIQLKDDHINKQDNYIEKLERLLEDNNISYDNACMK